MVTFWQIIARRGMLNAKTLTMRMSWPLRPMARFSFGQSLENQLVNKGFPHYSRKNKSKEMGKKALKEETSLFKERNKR